MIIKNQCKAYNSFIAMLRRENRIWIVFKAMVIVCKISITILCMAMMCAKA